jgi:hypothetical protein
MHVCTLGAPALPRMQESSCSSRCSLTPVHLHPPSSAAHATHARGHAASCNPSTSLVMLLEQWRHVACKARMLCSAHRARIAFSGRPWRHTGHFGPRSLRTRDAHELSSPSPASAHSRCPFVHCSMRPAGASASRVRKRQH